MMKVDHRPASGEGQDSRQVRISAAAPLVIRVWFGGSFLAMKIFPVVLMGALLLGCPAEKEEAAPAAETEEAPAPAPAAGEGEEQEQGDEQEQEAAAKEIPCPSDKSEASGKISEDTTWCGVVEVVGNVVVGKEATLTILPGAMVRFRPYRVGLRPDHRLRLRVEGRLVARGTKDQKIRFTTAHQETLNGDWKGVELIRSSGNHISYAVIEYGEVGLRIGESQATLEHVVIRWNNWQGIVMDQGSKVIMDSSRIYANGYNCIDATGGSDLQLTNSYLARCQPLGLHVGASTARLEENLFEGGTEGVYIAAGSKVDLTGNTFSAQRECAVSCDGKVTLRHGGNAFAGRPENQSLCCPKGQMKALKDGGDAPPVFSTGLKEGVSSYIDYLPGKQGHDPFAYTLADRSESRVVNKKYGAGRGGGWSVAYDEPYLWIAGLNGEVTRHDPEAEDVLTTFKVPTSKPWGMVVFDGKLWINDYNLEKILVLDKRTGKVLARHPSPDPKAGCRGMTHDGKNIYVLGYATPKVYVLDRKGAVVDHFPAPAVQVDSALKVTVSGALAWDGRAFWAPAGRLIRFDRSGKVTGWVHSTGATIRGLAWDGDYMWTAPRINYNWNEHPRYYRIEILKVLDVKQPPPPSR